MKRTISLVSVLGLGLVCTSLGAEDTWTRKADMPTARSCLATSVVNGKIYAIGGIRDASSAPLSTVEEYDPGTDTWTAKADMPTARISLCTSVVDGRIYAIGGGQSVMGTGSSTVQEYDPETDTWTTKAEMPTARFVLSSSAVNGKVYAIGGKPAHGVTPLSTVEEYDPTTNTWATMAPMPTRRYGLSTCVVNGKIYAVGGDPGTYVGLRALEEYDPVTDAWTRKADMPTARAYLSTGVVDGKIYAIGGESTLHGPGRSTVQEYDPATDTWTTKADMPTARLLLSSSAVNEKVYVIGGSVEPWPSWQACSTLEEYDPNPVVVDFNGDRIVDFKDYAHLAKYWQQDESSVDIAPPLGDNIIDFRDLAVLAEHWLEEYEEIVYIQWLAHASVKIWTDDAVVYVDPRNLSGSPHDATLVLVTHSHGDHYSPTDITKVWGPDTQLIASADVIASEGRGQALSPGQTTEADGVGVIGVAAYNTNKPNHPKANNWLGFTIEIGSRRIYCAGDTDLIPEMQTLGKIDVAFLPAGGTYTMNATEAAQAATIINPILAIPYHWGTSVGTLADAELFVRLAGCNAKIMSAGEILSSEDWSKDFSLLGYWTLDETAGAIAYDSAGNNDGALNGDPIWQPSDGKIDGALLLDGTDDYVSTPFVLNPAEQKFSVFAWIKGVAPGQVIISQIGGANWLLADPSEGKLMTNLAAPAGRFPPQPLASESVIIDGVWHRVGFTWDGSNRILYVDDVEVAKDTQSSLAGSEGGLYIGVGKNREAGTCFSGLIDDVRVYDRAVTP